MPNSGFKISTSRKMSVVPIRPNKNPRNIPAWAIPAYVSRLSSVRWVNISESMRLMPITTSIGCTNPEPRLYLAIWRQTPQAKTTMATIPKI